MRCAAILAFTLFNLMLYMNGGYADTVYYQEPIKACERGHDTPEVHVLPTGVGDVTPQECFFNGFEVIPPHTEVEETCTMLVKPPHVAEDNTATDPMTGEEVNCDTLSPPKVCCTEKATLVRRKYHCRFNGAGAILGETGDVWESGDKVYFQGQEPENFTTKDPDCKTMFKEINTASNRYCYLVK